LRSVGGDLDETFVPTMMIGSAPEE
jgi:hypothetical protein